MPDHCEIYYQRMFAQKGAFTSEFINKLLIYAVILILGLWILSPLREQVGSWVGIKSKTQLVTENATLSKDLAVAVEVNKSNEVIQVLKEEVYQAAQETLLEEAVVIKEVKTKTTERVKAMTEKVKVINKTPELDEHQKGELISEEVIDSVWDVYNQVTRT